MPNFYTISHNEKLGKEIRKRDCIYVVVTGEDEGIVCYSWNKAESLAKELIKQKGYESVEIKELLKSDLRRIKE